MPSPASLPSPRSLVHALSSKPIVALHGVTLATPDGRPLLENLDLVFGSDRTGLVGRNGIGKSTLLGVIAGEAQPHAGSVERSGRVAMLRQSVQAADGDTLADLLGIRSALARLRRLEAGNGSLADAAEADWTLESRLEAALAEVGLAGVEPDRPLATLSGGQRTRAALAALLIAEPDLILLDEPTNNLDADGRDAVARVLAGWKKGAVVVSHDRALLRPMDRIVELSSLGARIYGGGYDLYAARKREERAAAERDLDVAKRDAARGRAAHPDGARAQGTKRCAGRAQPRQRRPAQDPARRAEGAQPAARRAAPARLPTGNAPPRPKRCRRPRRRSSASGSSRCACPRPACPPGGRCSPSRASASPMPTARRLFARRRFRHDRTGARGADRAERHRQVHLPEARQRRGGADLRHGVAAGRPRSCSTRASRSSIPRETILDNFRRLDPAATPNQAHAALARFLFRNVDALKPVGALSGGEMLRAGLACTLGGSHPPQLLMLDEPTNHLDLDSIAAIEAALADFDGALLVASHDEDFLAAIGIARRLAFPLKGTRMTIAACPACLVRPPCPQAALARRAEGAGARGEARPLSRVAVRDHAAADDGRGGEALFRRLPRALAGRGGARRARRARR